LGKIGFSQNRVTFFFIIYVLCNITILRSVKVCEACESFAICTFSRENRL